MIMKIMTDLTLTTERRHELADLLDDEHRLRAEYPKVAQYLGTAPGLSGTGNAHADGAFDLRLVHFMTGGRASSDNPYWEIVGPSVFESTGRRVVNGGRSDGSPRLALAQMILQDAYAYAVPSPETIHWAAQFCADRSIIELGAGRGYWAMQLSGAGLNVSAYDIAPPGRGENASFTEGGKQQEAWFDVKAEDGFPADAEAADSVLFLCWPPGWGNTMASDALSAFERAGGQRLIYIGEPKGGKTGDDAFFNALVSNWHLETTDAQHTSWWNLDDTAQGWIRR